MSWLWILLWAPSLAVLTRLPEDRSRRLLSVSLALLIPLGGPALAMIALRVRGAGVDSSEADIAHGALELSPDDVRTLGEQPALLERLLSANRGERLAALVVLSTRADAHAVGLLRWTIARGSAEAVLDAALTLEELDVRHERALDATYGAVADEVSFERARAAADAAAAIVLTGLADGAVVPTLAERARRHYQLARSLAPERSPEIECRLARLELAAARPNEALAIVDALEATNDEIRQLRDDARFAARRFDALSYRPYSPPSQRDQA